MARVLIFCAVLIMSGVESCLIPESKHIVVRRHVIPAGSQITTVQFENCDPQSLIFTLKDNPMFSITKSGVIVTEEHVSVRGARTFSVWAQDNSGLEHEMVVYLHPTGVQDRQPTDFLKRSKRRWSPPPFNILENDDGPYPKDIEKINSDSEAKFNVYYTISGPGVDEHPIGVFSLNRDSGMLIAHKSVDREEFPQFTLVTRVFDRVSNRETDLPLPITIIVDDVNDNKPTFKGSPQFTVPEQSKPGTMVGKVDATDRDEPGSKHVAIRYFLLTGTDLFAINRDTGVITTVTNTLDRETKDKHMVTVQIKDMEGEPNGLFNTATATITLSDINDNAPTFTKSSYAVDVKENEKEKLILRIPIEDKDLINTPNWRSKFVITKGNENGNFRMDVDNKTNEGLLYVAKPLDFEKNKNVKLEISARNEAELQGTTSQWLSIPVDVNVIDEDEGPEFSAPTVRFTVKENTANGTLIGSYTALDPETKSSDGIKYFKLTDPASWINVDKNNGELRVANTIDRESKFVENGIYNITMKAVDASSKTGTGTVIIVVEDINDNVPTIPTGEMVLCEKEGELGSVVVVAEDKDDAPLSSPFSFSLPKDHDGKWSLTKLNDTAATLRHLKELPTGIHEVPIQVIDLQGFGKEQTAVVRICHCRNGACPTKETSASFGGLGILAMLLPLLLLLLLGLLLGLFCVTKKEKLRIDDGGDSGGILLKSNTEAPGDEVDTSLLTGAALGVDTIGKGSVKGVNSGWVGNQSTGTMGGQSAQENGIYKTGVVTSDMQEFYSSQYDSQYATGQFGGQFGGQLVGSGVNFDNRYLAQDSSFLHTWQTNGIYLDQKLGYFGTEEDGRYADDLIHSYGYEGAGSAAGSVGCCSEFGDNDNLDFLNALGPKFKTLGEVCRKT